LAGSPEYQSNGSIVLGTAEGGVKIYLNNGNAFSATNRSVLVDYMHIIEHEFAHILNQNINYDQSFQDICSGEYEPSTWDDYESDYDAYARGFLSTYAMSSPDEDYVETLSLLLVHGMDWLEGTVIPEAEASTVDPEAAQKIRAKIAHVENYLLNSFGIMLFDDPLTGKKGFVTRVQEAIDYTIEEALANEL
jgi:substrate import-associated zinc metallohydrolase lipoprotein